METMQNHTKKVTKYPYILMKCVKIYCPNINFTGTCCSDCNRSCVIPARMKDFFKVREEEEEEEGEEEEEEEEEGEEESRIIHPPPRRGELEEEEVITSKNLEKEINELKLKLKEAEVRAGMDTSGMIDCSGMKWKDMCNMFNGENWSDDDV
jgi:hypothetical protein